MSLPKKIKIGAFSFDVKMQDLNDLGHENSFGLTIPWKQSILIDPSQAYDSLADTLLHEAIHACWYVGGLAKDNEEELVKALSPWLLGVLRDNPKFLQFLLEDVQSKSKS